MEQKFGKNSILGRAKWPSRADIEALREFCESKGREIVYTVIILVFSLMVAHAEGQVNWKPLLKAVEFSERNFVDTIRKGSEAYEKGVRTGDLLIEADGTEKRVAIARTK